ncbi:hypothetical protein AKH19_01265 [Pelagibacteraceae bacterium GOM-A1]|nr:hypothetical protein AKH19_01265 [Pelagibacteraceae bacterium GOM-A1]
MDKNFIIDQNMINYIFSHTNNLHKVQKKLLKYNEKLGHIKKLQISILQANFIQFIIKINNYKSYLEIGTFTGYSILSAALALPKNCKLIGIDKNLKTNNEAINFFKEAKQEKKINLISDNGKIALENLIKKKEKYDLILIDADKENYINYFKQSLKLKSNKGIILIDNTLWKGDVANPKIRDKLTLKLREFNKYIKKSSINKYILPIGDGFTVCW